MLSRKKAPNPEPKVKEASVSYVEREPVSDDSETCEMEVARAIQAAIEIIEQNISVKRAARRSASNLITQVGDAYNQQFVLAAGKK